MTLVHLIPIAIQLSMAIIIFCVGLHARFADITYLIERPGLLVKSLLAMNVVMPAIAVLAAVLFDLSVAVEIALVALALSPIPPILPNKELKAGGASNYVVGLMVVTALLSIVFVPVVATLLGRAFGRPVNVAFVDIAKIVLIWMLLPLFAGVCLRRLSSRVADQIARPLSVFGTLLLVVAFAPVLVGQWHTIVGLLGNFTLIAIVLFTLCGLAFGHAMGGPDLDNRSVLALSTATRHPAVAMAVVHESQDKQAILAAVLLALLAGGLVSAPYVKWRRRSHDAAALVR